MTRLAGSQIEDDLNRRTRSKRIDVVVWSLCLDLRFIYLFVAFCFVMKLGKIESWGVQSDD